MPIPVTCPCGQRYQAKDELAGKQLKCPACGATLTVPSPSALDDDPLGAAMPSGPARGGERRLSSPSSGKPSSNPLLIPLVIGGAIVVVALLVLIIVLTRPDGDVSETAQNVDPNAPAAIPPLGGGADGASGANASSDSVGAPSTRGANPADPTTAPPKPQPGAPVLPGAVVAPPAHLQSDAPFPINDFFAAPPRDQNAAPLYLDALFEFSPEASSCFAEPESQQRLAAVRQRMEKTRPVYQQWLDDETSASAEALDQALAEYAGGFRKLDAAQQRAECVFQPDIGMGALLPHAQAAREVARWTEILVQRKVDQGQIDSAIQDVARLLRLSRDLRPRGVLVSQLVSAALDSVCLQSVVMRVLTAKGITTQQCDRMLQLLAEHERAGKSLWTEGLRGEYVTLRSVIHDLQHRVGEFDPATMKEDFGTESPGELLLGLASLDGSSGTNGAQLDQLLAKMTPQNFARELSVANQWYEQMSELDGQNYAAQSAAIAKARQSTSPQQTPLFAILAAPADAWLEAFVRNRAQLRGAQCLAAVRRWRLAHPGQPPADLETVCQEAGMQAIPADPYGTGTLKMAFLQNVPVIYSVGKDGKDDGAQADWNFGQQPGDFIFELKRRQ